MVIDARKKFKGCFIISGDGNSDHPSAPEKKSLFHEEESVQETRSLKP
jgi:hypothetical protein